MRKDYYGSPLRAISNGYLTVEFLAGAGPRVVGLWLAGCDANLLAETPGVTWPTPFGTYHLYGGHRLWHAPEAAPRSSVPDDGPLAIDDLPLGVRLRGPLEAYTGIRKTIEIRLTPGCAAVTLRHTLRNEGPWPVELAPWAITQLPLGGVAVLPQPSGPADPAGLAPNRCLAFWPYTRWADARLDFSRDDCLCVRATGQPEPCKIGYFNQAGWVAYVRAGTAICKRFTPAPGRPHADFGSNVEVYTSDVCLELETLGPLARLAPGDECEHVETWEVYGPQSAWPADLAALSAIPAATMGT